VAEFPALPFWTDAYLADCQHLSWAEHGIYLMLLVHMWRSPDGKIPNNDLWLAKRLRCSEGDVANAVRPIITEFCKCDGNWIWQRRLIDELTWVRKKQRKNTVSAKARWNKEKTDANAQSTHMQSQSERISERNAPTPTPTPTITPEGFDLFWSSYPRHVAKQKAIKAYRAAIAIAAPAEILAGVKRFRFSSDPQYQPHPASWLNQRRWQDEEAPSRPTGYVPGAI
jgi:uncharacterized protein YdaU (DUF1376 family)